MKTRFGLKVFKRKSFGVLYFSFIFGFLLTVYYLMISSSYLHKIGVYRFIVKDDRDRAGFLRNFSMPLSKIRIREWISVPENQQEDDWSFAVYDVFYDPRVNKTVIFGASHIAEMREKFAYFVYTYRCLYFNGDGDFVTMVTASFYTSYMVYCDPPPTEIPRYVTLIRDEAGDKSRSPEWMMPVRTVTEPRPGTNYDQELALCVGIIFANQPWLTLLQFFEFHLTQGVRKFYVFYYDIRNKVTRRILSYYTKKYPNLIDLIEWAPTTRFCGHYWCQLMRDNYCLYSNIGRHRYLGFVDIDELLYPVFNNKDNSYIISNNFNNSDATLLQLLKDTDRTYIGSFVFRVQWHQTLRDDCPFWRRVDPGQSRRIVQSYLPFLQYSNVSTLAHELYSPKTVVKPEKVLRKWIHFVREHTPGAMYYFMNESQAYLMHFKIRSWWGPYAEQAEKIVNFTIIDSYQAFDYGNLIDNLIERVVRVIVEIKTKIK